MAISNRCPETGLSVSYAYKKGCRCPACRANKARYTANDVRAYERSRAWKQANPQAVKRSAKKTYDKTWLRVHGELYQKQGGKCAICRGPGGARRLHLDHNHETGELRELLCSGCNTGLGLFKEDPEVLRKAIEYLKKHERNGDV